MSVSYKASVCGSHTPNSGYTTILQSYVLIIYMNDIQYYVQKSKVIYIMFNYEFLKIDYLNYSSLLYYACEFHILAPQWGYANKLFKKALFRKFAFLKKATLHGK